MNSPGSLIVAAILSLACAPMEAHAKVPLATDRLPAALTGARTVVDAFHQALRSGNREAALSLLADDALIYESGHAEGKRQYAAHHLDADIAFARQIPATILKRTGGVSGPVAWITSEGRTTGTFKGKAVDLRTVETALFLKEAGAWKIVHLHWSSAAMK